MTTQASSKNKNSRIDEYITKSFPFAQPILAHLRKLVHEACPETEEKIKWGFPHFDYKGPMCSMAAFKEHCAFTFWKGELLDDPDHLLDKNRMEAMGQLGKITCLSGLPPDSALIAFIKNAMRLNEEGIKLPKNKAPMGKKELDIPVWFKEALNSNPKAREAFENFSYSHRKEYLEYVTEAKRDETRQKRMQQSIEWLAEGKSRNWKYEKK